MGNGTTAGLSGVTTAWQSIGSGYRSSAVSRYHSFGIKTDGSLWAWGINGDGVLGDGTTTERYSPVPIESGITEVAPGAYHTVVLKSDGNGNGQLGDDTNTSRATPAQISSGYGSIAAGAYHTVAVKFDGALLAWGDNSYGQLGDGTLATQRTPVLAVNATLNDYLTLNASAAASITTDLQVPFFVTTTGGITANTESVSTRTLFAAEDEGNEGNVYVTARVPAGSLAPVAAAVPAPGASTFAYVSAPGLFDLVQLTPSGWQTVTNGQLIPYASGVLSRQVTQTILSSADTTNLKGAEFCVGYSTATKNMVSRGTIRTVATIPDPNASGGGQLIKYTVACTAPGHPTLSASGNSSPIVLRAMAGSVSYSCSISASNGMASSAQSAPLMVTALKPIGISSILMLLLN